MLPAVFAALFYHHPQAVGYALSLFLAARYLAARRRHMFCVVVAAISCAFSPLGTVLGVFTLIVLYRPSVREQFSSRAAEG